MIVLVVEDNELNLELATIILEAEGHVVEAARDGAALRRWISSDAPPPAVVLMDIHLPDTDGVTLLGELRALSRLDHVPVAALTANALTGDAERLRAAGFDEVLVKPIDTRQFAAQVAAVAAIRRGV